MSKTKWGFKVHEADDIQRNLDWLQSQLEQLFVSDETSHSARKRIVCDIGFLIFPLIVLTYNVLFALTKNTALIITGVLQIPFALISICWLIRGRIRWPHLSHYVLAGILFMDTTVGIFSGQGTLLGTHFYYLFFTVGVAVVVPSNMPRFTWLLMLVNLTCFTLMEFFGVPAASEIAAMDLEHLKSFQMLVFLSMTLSISAAVYFADWSYFVLEDRLIKLASQDFLTGLPNRRAFHSHLKRKQASAKATEGSYCICILDIDHFKKVNDTYGHDIGDEVLKFVAQHLKDSVRVGDFVARLGGEEFVLFMPEIDLTDAIHVAERVRKAIDMCVYEGNGITIHVTISIGIIESYPDATDAELFELADQALYRAKQNGRNKLEIGTRSTVTYV
ncbi:GGDEF domain-containing protein [Undibacterium curvum]|uniref:GGDEF domain-containing protein n=1 Tax=Undibacterium curvum TaxID=2762294 RepID=UPI003D145D7C